MKKCLIMTIVGLSLLTFSITSLAGGDSQSVKHRDQQLQLLSTKHGPYATNKRLSGAQTKTRHHVQQYKRFKTDHKAVERRIAKHDLADDYKTYNRYHDTVKQHYQQDRIWLKKNRGSTRFVSRRDFYNYYVSYRNIHFYDRYTKHYDETHSRHSRHAQFGHYNHSNDYLEWATIMYLLNNVYDDGRFSEHHHKRRGA